MEKILKQLLVTRWKDKILTAHLLNGKIIQLDLSEEGSTLLNSIIIGKVQNIVKNINAAFVDLGKGLVGYYSLTENKDHLYTKNRTPGSLREGDEIIVQVVREGVKTKAPVLSSHLNFTGRYCVLTLGKNGIGFSSKIQDENWKKEIKPLLLSKKDEDFGIIVRTNAREVSTELLLNEIQALKEKKEQILKDGLCRTCYCVLYESLPSYVSGLRDIYLESLEEIVTDQRDLYDVMSSYMSENARFLLRFYEDNQLPLLKLYSLETAISQALAPRVWLKSGGYLVIEPTEALTVIDVNTGKYSGKKTLADTILKINLEAAKEIAYQLRLRNLSGIILIDFIDSARPEDGKLLMETLEQLVHSDPIKTTVVDMTKLNLVEVTRKKVKKPLYEQIQGEFK